MLIVNGVVHTMDTGVIPLGFVLVRGSRIAQVGPMSGLPQDAGPGGSIRDDNVIETADRYNMVMTFTGMRLFHH